MTERVRVYVQMSSTMSEDSRVVRALEPELGGGGFDAWPRKGKKRTNEAGAACTDGRARYPLGKKREY